MRQCIPAGLHSYIAIRLVQRDVKLTGGGFDSRRGGAA